MSLLLDAFFSSVAFSHFVVDVLNGNTSVLLAYFSGPLVLTNATIGLVSTTYTVAGSLMQPIFGVLSDRFGARWVVAGGVFWMAVFYSLAMVIPDRTALVFLVLASLGSGAFHPAGTMQATRRGRDHDGRETTATSYFFLFGQAGLFFGPFIGGFLLESVGPRGLLLLTAFSVPVGINAAYRLRGSGDRLGTQVVTTDLKKDAVKISIILILAFASFAALRSWVQQSMVVFVPKYLSDLGLGPGFYGSLSALFMAGSGLGNVAGGNLADRFGKYRVAGISLALASVPIIIIPFLGWSPWLYLLIPLAGALSGASHSIVVVFAQKLIPGGMGLASGLILGFTFSSGAIGALLSGYLADVWGVSIVFPVAAGAALGAAVFSRVLRRDDEVRSTQSQVAV
jgi:FSR family fosmidomycin resistance protein-like MFS transporter